jgi:hypothetical protein
MRLLPSNGRVCKATAVCADFTVLALSKHATIFFCQKNIILFVSAEMSLDPPPPRPIWGVLRNSTTA